MIYPSLITKEIMIYFVLSLSVVAIVAASAYQLLKAYMREESIRDE
jgi:hypothetical protein